MNEDLYGRYKTYIEEKLDKAKKNLEVAIVGQDLKDDTKELIVSERFKHR